MSTKRKFKCALAILVRDGKAILDAAGYSLLPVAPAPLYHPGRSPSDVPMRNDR